MFRASPAGTSKRWNERSAPGVEDHSAAVGQRRAPGPGRPGRVAGKHARAWNFRNSLPLRDEEMPRWQPREPNDRGVARIGELDADLDPDLDADAGDMCGRRSGRDTAVRSG